MSYFLPNLGRKRTASRSIECLAGSAGLTGGPVTMRYREVGESWSLSQTFKPYFRMELSEDLGSKTVELELYDTVTTVNLTQTIELLAEADPYVPWAPDTQDIANKLPIFHKGRRLRDSNWQKFMNGPGQGLSLVRRQSEDLVNSRYIRSSPVHELDSVGRIWTDQAKIFSPKDDNANRVVNPSLTLHRTPFSEPQDWALNGDYWRADTTDSLFGYSSLECQPPNGERVTAVQVLPIEMSIGETLTAGLYYKTSLASTTSPLSATDFSLEVVVLYEDGDSEVSSVILTPGTDGRWYLETVSLQAAKRVTRAFVVVVIQGQPTISPFPLHIGGVQAQVGTFRGSFSFGNTEPFFLKNPLNNALEPQKELWMVGSGVEFENDLIPTRVDTPVGPTAGSFTAPATQATQFRIANSRKESVPLAYQQSNNKIALAATSPAEIIKEYDLAFYDQGLEGYVASSGFRVEAVTYSRGRAWAVGSFEDQTAADEFLSITEWVGFGEPVNGSNRMRYLLVLNSQLPAEVIDYMEVLAAYPLVELADGNPVVDVEFVSGDPRWVHYRTATAEYYSRLYYDVAWPQSNGSVLTREVYADMTLR